MLFSNGNSHQPGTVRVHGLFRLTQGGDGIKVIKRRMRVLLTLLLCLFAAMVAYFCYSVYFYGGRWVSNVHNPRIADGKQKVIMGTVTDRAGTVLAYTDAGGERRYNGNRETRMAVSQVVGDDGGKVSTGVDTFHAQYLLGFKASVLERLTDAVTGTPQRLSLIHI